MNKVEKWLKSVVEFSFTLLGRVWGGRGTLGRRAESGGDTHACNTHKLTIATAEF